MTKRYLVAASALAISLLLGAMKSANAVDGPLDQIGGVCVPDSATVRAGFYETRGFGIGFSGNSTGKIPAAMSIHRGRESDRQKSWNHLHERH